MELLIGYSLEHVVWQVGQRRNGLLTIQRSNELSDLQEYVTVKLTWQIPCNRLRE